jgi:hypothetical protein
LFGHIGYVSLYHLDIAESRSKYSAIAPRVQPHFITQLSGLADFTWGQACRIAFLTLKRTGFLIKTQ